MTQKRKKIAPEKDKDCIIGTNNVYYIILGCLTLIGLFLRFRNLDFNSLWLDEATTAMVSSRSFEQIWQTMTSGEFNPPLFYWIEHVMLGFGNNEFILRFIPALLGTATIPMIYYAGKEYIDRNVGIIAATAFTFSPFLILYSQEARAYSPMLFFITVATIFYFKALKSNDYKNWGLFAVFSALAFWSHFYAMVIIISYILYALMIFIKDKKSVSDSKQLLSMIGAFILLCSPLIIITIQLFGLRTSSAPTYGIKGLDIIIETFRQVSGFSDIVMYLFLMLFVIGLFQAYIMDRNKFHFLVWTTISIFFVSYFISFKIPMIPRYLQFLNIIFFIGIALSYKVFYKLLNSKTIVYFMMLLFIVLSVPFLSTYYSGQSKDDWRGFGKSVSQITQPGDYVVYVPKYLQTPMEYYYSDKMDRTIIYGAYNVSELKDIKKNNNSIYYVVTGDIMATDPSGESLRWLDANAKVVLRNNNIYLFKG